MRAGGATPLHVAVESASIEVIRLLLEAEADPNTCSDVSCIFHVN
jgi:ankyrin repeat protein